MKQRGKGGAKQEEPGVFPGGGVTPDPGELRIAVDRTPYAEIIGHAVVQPDIEVCGVLVGRLERDEHGSFVRVTAAIRGEAAKEAGANVTFTHETWNHIHQEMDRAHPDEQIVGWYHTHGGFGVFLSEMDTFVHRNFFGEPHQVAYVYDPLAGSEGFFHRKGEALVPARRYWLGGRERKPAMRMPEPEPAAPAAAPRDGTGGAGGAAALERAAEALRLAAASDRGGGLAPLLPWAVAGAALLLLLLNGRGGLSPLAPQEERAGPILLLDHDPATGRVVGFPLEVGEMVEGGVVRGVDGRLRPAIVVRGVDGVPLAQPGLVTRLVGPGPSPEEAARQREKAEADAAAQRTLHRMLLWVGAGVLAVAALGAGAWYFLARR